MKKIKNLQTKNLSAILFSLLLAVATAIGILAVARKPVHAETIPNIERSMHRFESVFTITDVGPLKNSYDIFDGAEYFPDMPELIYKGYRYVTVDLDFYMKEIDDGFQDAYLYKNDTDKEEEYLERIIFDYGTNRINASWGHVNLHFRSLPLIRFLDNDFRMGFIIRYDGHGKNDDTWENKYLSVKVTLSQTEIRSANTVDGYDVKIG